MKESFLYKGFIVTVEDKLDTDVWVTATVNNITEVVEPQRDGFITSPMSNIAKLFNQQGVAFIPYESAEGFYNKVNISRIDRHKKFIRSWVQSEGAAHGGLLYGEIKPGMPVGWYLVLMMKSCFFSGYVDYIEKGIRYIGESALCEELRDAYGINDVYVANGVQFLTTIVFRNDVEKILKEKMKVEYHAASNQGV